MRRFAGSRFVTTLVMVASLLFMQLALASYVCPVAPLDDEQQAAMQAMDMAPGEHCLDMDADAGSQPTLCHQHCTNAAQSFEPVKLPTLTQPAVVQVLIVPLRVDPEASLQAAAFAATGQAQPPPSPVFLSTLRLRV